MTITAVDPKVESWPRCIYSFKAIADQLEPLEPGERVRVLAAAVCLFDIEVANNVVRTWRGKR